MDHKAWLWRKRSTEKTAVATDKRNHSLKGNEEEIQMLLADKAELENDLKNLNDKLSSALSECNAKDDIVKKHEKMAQEANTGWKKAEAEAVFLQQELDEALRQRVAGEERLTHFEAALKECMQQLRFVREEQEQRIHDAVMKTSKEYEKAQMILEENFAETSRRLEKIVVENTHLSKALLAKEKIIDDLKEQRAQAEADFNSLMTRLKSTEKDNSSLKYEVRLLEKELEIRNEEKDFSRRTAEASHKQHLESVKKIAKLESECQRLRLLVRKRLPGPAALAKMKNEVEMLGRDSIEIRRRKLNTSPTCLMVDSSVDNYPDTPSKRINILTEQLCSMEEENKTLMEALNKKTNELQFLRIMYAPTAPKLLEESQLEEPSKGQMATEPNRSGFMSHEVSGASVPDIGTDDKVSSAESRASALISELENFRNEKHRGSPAFKTVGASEMNLMDDFVEMEKLAVVSVNKPSRSSHVSSDEANAIVGPLEAGSNGNSSEVMGGEIISLSDCQSSFSVLNQKINPKFIGKLPGWLQDILKVVLEQNLVARRNPDKILEDIRVALSYINQPNSSEFVDARESSDNATASDPSSVSGYISWKPSDKRMVMDSLSEIANMDTSFAGKHNQHLQSNLNKSICKLIELIEGISLPSPDYGIPETLSKKDGSYFSYKNSEASSGYIVRVFQWKSSELSDALQQFVHTCYDMLNGKADLNKFSQELSSALDWIMNHCFSLQDVSSMRDAIMKHLDWDDSRSECEAEVGIIGQISEADKLCLPRERFSPLLMVAASNVHNNFSQKEERQSSVREENRKLRDESNDIEAVEKDLEGRLQSATDKSDSMMNKHQESDKTIANLQRELDSLKNPKGVIKDQVEDHKLINEDLETRLTLAKVELNKAHQKFSSLEADWENKSSCCAELESKHLELQLQPESVTKDEILASELKQEENQLRTDWEITAASEKLAECQETILNLGKQLKALANPKEAALFDKAISTLTDITTTTTNPTPTSPKNNIFSQRSSLLDQMIAEDNAGSKDPESPNNGNYGNLSSALSSNGAIEPLEKILILNGNKHKVDNTAVNLLAIVPSKNHRGKSLWKKLLWRKKNGNSKNPPHPFAPRQIFI